MKYWWDIFRIFSRFCKEKMKKSWEILVSWKSFGEFINK
jgi:hypothetical protein